MENSVFGQPPILFVGQLIRSGWTSGTPLGRYARTASSVLALTEGVPTTASPRPRRRRRPPPHLCGLPGVVQPQRCGSCPGWSPTPPRWRTSAVPAAERLQRFANLGLSTTPDLREQVQERDRVRTSSRPSARRLQTRRARVTEGSSPNADRYCLAKRLKFVKPRSRATSVTVFTRRSASTSWRRA